MTQLSLKPCPFCGDVPPLPDGMGTQYEIECPCGHTRSCVQITDLMTIEERLSDNEFSASLLYYGKVYIERAKQYTIEAWNTRIITTQSRTESAIETAFDLIIGFGIAMAITYYAAPLFNLSESNAKTSFLWVAMFTIVSFVRRFTTRRLFNTITHRRFNNE